ncbi:hypothetical protein GCM10027262_74830 [Nocardia tengchongensis]
MLEFGYRAEDLEEHAVDSSGGVDALVQDNPVHTPVLESSNGSNRTHWASARSARPATATLADEVCVCIQVCSVATRNTADLTHTPTQTTTSTEHADGLAPHSGANPSHTSTQTAGVAGQGVVDPRDDRGSDRIVAMMSTLAASGGNAHSAVLK